MPITFTKLQQYLDAVAGNATLDPANAPHGVFWHVALDTFKTMNVPNVLCGGQALPLLKVGDGANSALYAVLISDKSPIACQKKQMPDGGPLITDAGYNVALPDGTMVAGAQIASDIKDWIDAGCPL